MCLPLYTYDSGYAESTSENYKVDLISIAMTLPTYVHTNSTNIGLDGVRAMLHVVAHPTLDVMNVRPFPAERCQRLTKSEGSKRCEKTEGLPVAQYPQ